MFTINSRVRSRFSTTRTLGLLGALILASGLGAAVESPIRSIEVVQDSDRYRADVVMFAPVPLNVAWDVLTDFDHMAKWVPNLRESKGTVTEPNTVMVEQQGVAKFGFFSFPYSSVRKMQLNPQKTVKATQIAHDAHVRRQRDPAQLPPRDGSRRTCLCGSVEGFRAERAHRAVQSHH